MHIRRATHHDAGPVAQLVARAYGKYVERIGREPKPMTADYATAIAQHHVWVVSCDDEVGAVLELIPHADHLLIENIAVEPQRQRTGLGGALLRFAEDEARRQALGELRLYTNAMFTENLAIYSKAGYRETHREPIGAGHAVHMSKQIF
jgi:N-acetylglutamate synthase-like GNAT family acetyltransferase